MAKIFKITLFVNPHKFYYIEDDIENEGYSKPLDDMEFKIKGSLNKYSQTPNAENQEEIQIMDTVAVFMRDWHKWVRGVVKAKNRNGSFHVWVVDYGIPIVSRPSQTIKLQGNYAKMNMKRPRVRLGGLANCVPAENTYDFDQNAMILREQQKWSQNAISISKGLINHAVQLKFEEDKELKMADGPHVFGYLKFQKADGSWADLASCLQNALVCQLTNDNWVNRVKNLDTIKQNEWLSVEGVPLHAHVEVSPILRQVENDIEGVTAQANCLTLTMSSHNEDQSTAKRRNDDRERTPDNRNAERNSRPFQKRGSSVTRNMQMQNSRGFNANKFHSRQFNRNDSSSEYLYNGKLNDRKYRDENNFFERNFGLRSTPNKKEDSSHGNSTDKPDEDENETVELSKSSDNETIKTQHQTKDNGNVGDNLSSQQQQAQKVDKNYVMDGVVASKDLNHENENGPNDKQSHHTESVDVASSGKQSPEVKPIKVKMPSNGVANDRNGNTEEIKPKKENDQSDGNVTKNNIEVKTTGMPGTSDHRENSSATKLEEKRAETGAIRTETAI